MPPPTAPSRCSPPVSRPRAAPDAPGRRAGPGAVDPTVRRTGRPRRWDSRRGRRRPVRRRGAGDDVRATPAQRAEGGGRSRRRCRRRRGCRPSRAGPPGRPGPGRAARARRSQGVVARGGALDARGYVRLVSGPGEAARRPRRPRRRAAGRPAGAAPGAARLRPPHRRPRRRRAVAGPGRVPRPLQRRPGQLPGVRVGLPAAGAADAARRRGDGRRRRAGRPRPGRSGGRSTSRSAPATTPTTASATSCAGRSTSSTARPCAPTAARPTAARAWPTATRPPTTPTTGTPTARPRASRTTRRGRSTASPSSRACSTPPAARSRPTGLSMPWYTAYGNHDGLVQGNFPRSFQLGAVATGPVKVVGLPAGVSPDDLAAGAPGRDPAGLAGRARRRPGAAGDPRPGARDRHPHRVGPGALHHRRPPARPRLHRGRTSPHGTAHYVFDPTPAGARDRARHRQPERQQRRLARRRPVRLAAAPGCARPAEPARSSSFSHHTVASMTNQLVAADDPQQRVLGPEVRDLLLTFPNVVLWVNGHTHRNRVTPHRARRRRRVLGGPDRGPRRLAVPVAPGRARRQRRRHAVGLRHDARRRRPAVLRRRPVDAARARVAGPRARRQRLAGARRRPAAARRRTATSSCSSRRRSRCARRVGVAPASPAAAPVRRPAAGRCALPSDRGPRRARARGGCVRRRRAAAPPGRRGRRALRARPAANRPVQRPDRRPGRSCRATRPLLVAVGGAAGACARYGLGLLGPDRPRRPAGRDAAGERRRLPAARAAGRRAAGRPGAAAAARHRRSSAASPPSRRSPCRPTGCCADAPALAVAHLALTTAGGLGAAALGLRLGGRPRRRRTAPA